VLGREPTDQEVARKLGWEVGRVKNVKSAIPDATSLNRTLSSDEDSSELGVSRERVRQLQREAEGVLRDAAGEHRLGFPTAA